MIPPDTLAKLVISWLVYTYLPCRFGVFDSMGGNLRLLIIKTLFFSSSIKSWSSYWKFSIVPMKLQVSRLLDGCWFKMDGIFSLYQKYPPSLLPSMILNHMWEVCLMGELFCTLNYTNICGSSCLENSVLVINKKVNLVSCSFDTAGERIFAMNFCQ